MPVDPPMDPPFALDPPLDPPSPFDPQLNPPSGLDPFLDPPKQSHSQTSRAIGYLPWSGGAIGNKF